jgi:L-threonylcarbamoyladenylate synthase
VTAEILPTHTAALFATAVKRAVDLLCAGEVVALPTETVYGLAANALDPGAVAKIFQIKGRPAHNPLIVHVADRLMAERCVRAWTPQAEKLARAFWPGPLTLVLPRSPVIPAIVTAGGPTVGLRWPSHPFIQAVLRECAFPLAAPSANLSNRISPTNASHVHQQLGGALALIVDGGQSQVGIESTVLDISGNVPRILRPGMIHAATLSAVIGPADNVSSLVAEDSETAAETLRSPGLLKKHYSPLGRLVLLTWQDETDLARQLAALKLNPAACHVLAHTHIPSPEMFAQVCLIPHDAEAFARALYAELHSCDALGAQTIIVELPPESPEWSGITDRLRRAAV